MAEISSKSVRKSSFRLSTKNAWAQYVRKRWRANALGAIQAEWDLTEGEARGVLYAQASQTTTDKIMDHELARSPYRAFRLGLTILQIRTEIELEGYIAHLAQEAAHEAAKWAAEERAQTILLSRLPGPGGFDGGDDQQARPGGSRDETLGAGALRPPVGEHPKTFDRRP